VSALVPLVPLSAESAAERSGKIGVLNGRVSVVIRQPYGIGRMNVFVAYGIRVLMLRCEFVTVRLLAAGSASKRI
jgi:hypothetical protein